MEDDFDDIDAMGGSDSGTEDSTGDISDEEKSTKSAQKKGQPKIKAPPRGGRKGKEKTNKLQSKQNKADKKEKNCFICTDPKYSNSLTILHHAQENSGCDFVSGDCGRQASSRRRPHS